MECLAALESEAAGAGLELSAVVVDDGSTDGTADAVTNAFSWAHVVRSDGSLYWCRGMHMAFSLALPKEPDYLLFLNDDTVLEQGALERLRRTAVSLNEESPYGLIVVGTTVDPQTGALTYGGEVRHSRFRPMNFRRVIPTDQPQRCDSMNGNVVLISAQAAKRVGNLDPRFEHAMGDTDYALRANKAGVGVWVASGTYGYCSKNSIVGTFMDASLPGFVRLRKMLGRKGLPWRSWLIVTSRHAGFLWPLHFVWPYLKVFASGILRCGKTC